MRKCYDGQKTKWLDAFVDEFREAARRKHPELPLEELREFGVLLVAVMQETMSDQWASGVNGGRHTALEQLADNLFLSRKTVTRLLKLAARAGFVKALTYYSAGKGRYLPLETFIHPELKKHYDAGTGHGKLRGLVMVFAEMWLERRAYTEDVQGFETICQWGTIEEQDVVVLGQTVTDSGELVAQRRNWVEEIKLASAGTRVDDKTRRAADARKWGDIGKQFVEASARVWQVMQARAGFGYEPPAWSGSYNDLSSPNKRQYRDLVKIFEQYGGLKSSLAWALFCGGKPDYDSAGKLKFLPAAAHKQWVTPDKKPEQFAKHITLIFRELTHLRWLDEPETVERIRTYYGGLVDVTPRHGSAINQHKENTHDDASAPALSGTTTGGGDGLSDAPREQAASRGG